MYFSKNLIQMTLQSTFRVVLAILVLISLQISPKAQINFSITENKFAWETQNSVSQKLKTKFFIRAIF
jgi:hypothetical protein